MSSKSLLDHLAANPSARITLPVRDGARVSLPCTVEKIEPPTVTVRLKPRESLPDLEPQGSCLLTCDSSDAFTIHARLEEVTADRLLHLHIFEVAPLVQKRRFFRIDAELHMRYWQNEGEGESATRAVLKNVNLSGCGIRFTAPEPLRIGQKVKLELTFPAPIGGTAQAVGKVVRLENRDDHQDAALDLVEIDAEEQEKIIRFCLAEQLRQLRLKVRVRGTGR